MVFCISKIEKGEVKISITLGDDLICFLANYSEKIMCEDGSFKSVSKLQVGDKIVFELFDGKDTFKKPTTEDFQKIENLFLSKRRFYDKLLSNFVLYN